MKFDTPATTNPIDRLTVIGRPTERIDGRLKVTGTASYSYERHDVVDDSPTALSSGRESPQGPDRRDGPAGGEGGSRRPRHRHGWNAGKLGTGEFYVDRLLAGPIVDHYHQAVAVFVAETFEQARVAAGLIRVDYAREQGAYDLAAEKDAAVTPKAGKFGPPPETSVADFEGAFAAAPVQLDATYTTPDQTHATMAAWEGDQLTCWCPIQQLN